MPDPLPAGWSAAVVGFDLDTNQAPPRRIATLQISGPNGVTFKIIASCLDSALWGLSAAQIAEFLWPQVAEHVAETIAFLTNPSNNNPAPPAVLNVPVEFT